MRTADAARTRQGVYEPQELAGSNVLAKLGKRVAPLRASGAELNDRPSKSHGAVPIAACGPAPYQAVVDPRAQVLEDEIAPLAGPYERCRRRGHSRAHGARRSRHTHTRAPCSSLSMP